MQHDFCFLPKMQWLLLRNFLMKEALVDMRGKSSATVERKTIVGFEVLTPIYVFLDIMPCSRIIISGLFGGTCHLLRGRRISQARNQHEASSKPSCTVTCNVRLPEYGRAVAQRLDAGFPPRRPGFAYGQHLGFVVDKAALGQVFSEYFGFPCQSFHRFLHYHNHPGLTQ
jgi:hypothetical protein